MKFLRRNLLCCILSLVLVFSVTGTANAASVTNTNPKDTSVVDLSDARSTQVSSASGVLQAGNSKTYTFTVSKSCTLNFYASGSIVDSFTGGGKLSFLAAIYDFNEYTGCIASVPVSSGTYSYTVYNPNSEPITFGVVVTY